jgi:hypothetical protein
VLYFDFSTIAHATVDELKLSISYEVSRIAENHGIDVSSAPTASAKLKLLIEKLGQQRKVVLTLLIRSAS